MLGTLPDDVRAVLDRFVTTEYTTLDAAGQPITWPVTPYPHPEGRCIDVTTGLGYPKKARDAQANPYVALLFSEPRGSGLAEPPMVLVQGVADVDERDLDANAERYKHELLAKLPATRGTMPPKPLHRFMDWYFKRIYVHVRPERVYVWPRGDIAGEPQLYDSHLEEVRSGHSEEPEAAHPEPAGGTVAWDDRMDELGRLYPSAVVSLTAPDGFPFSVRVPVTVDAPARRIRVGGAPVGVPWQPGLACVCAHEHAPDFSWQRNFHVRGDLVRDGEAWAVVPRKLVGGFELPPDSGLRHQLATARASLRYRKRAKRELARR